MTWSEYLRETDAAYELAPSDAEARLLALLEQCGAEYGRGSMEYGSMRNELGAFYKGQGRFAEAEDCFKGALSLFERHAGVRSPFFATALNNLAGTHRLAGSLDEAEEEFRRCLAIYSDTVGESHILYASGLNNLSLVYLDRNLPDKAAALLSDAAEILRALPDARDELAVSLINLGALLRELGRTEEAEARLREALRMFREELGTDTPHYHAALNELGSVCLSAGRFAEAEALFTSAADAAEALYGADHCDVTAARKHAQLARKAAEPGSQL